MLQTPWYLDYGHLVFWFFFFSTFVIIMWLLYIYTSLAHNIEARKPVRETRGFSRAQVGDTMTAVLPLTWSVTMLAHASTHSSNFDENTTATVFSFTVIAYQWGWNYYFPRDIIETIGSASSLVGHKRAVDLYPTDAYSDLLAQARVEYTSKLLSSNQLSAKHGKYVLNQFLLASCSGSSVLNEHRWFFSNLGTALPSPQPKFNFSPNLLSERVGGFNPDLQLTLLKELSVLGTSLNIDLIRLYQRVFTFNRVDSFTRAQTPKPGFGLGEFGTGAALASNVRAKIFSGVYHKNKSNTNMFRAPITTSYTGNRLTRVSSHLTGSGLAFGLTSQQNLLVRNTRIVKSLSGDTAPLTYYQNADSMRGDAFVGFNPSNVGANLWLTRAFKGVTDNLRPWVFSSLGANTTATDLRAPEALTRWVLTEDILADFANNRGGLNFSKFWQKFIYSGEDLTLCGGESQRFTSGELTALSANAGSEFANLKKILSKRLGTNLPVDFQGAGLAANAHPTSTLPVIDVATAALSLPSGLLSGFATSPSLDRWVSFTHTPVSDLGTNVVIYSLGLFDCFLPSDRSGTKRLVTLTTPAQFVTRPLASHFSHGGWFLSKLFGEVGVCSTPLTKGIIGFNPITRSGISGEIVSLGNFNLTNLSAGVPSAGYSCSGAARGSDLSSFSSCLGFLGPDSWAKGFWGYALSQGFNFSPDLGKRDFLGNFFLSYVFRHSPSFEIREFFASFDNLHPSLLRASLPSLSKELCSIPGSRVWRLLGSSSDPLSMEYAWESISVGLRVTLYFRLLEIASRPQTSFGFFSEKTTPSPASPGFKGGVGVSSPINGNNCNVYPELSTHWLEGVSDIYPTRVADPAGNDLVFLNAKDLKSSDRTLLRSSSLFFDWWSRWSWEVLSYNLPWDRLFRSSVSKKPVGGLGASKHYLDSIKQVELLDVARQRFDKNAGGLVLPSTPKLSGLPVFSELSTSTMDSEFGHRIHVPLVSLPSPHVDIDPSFLFRNLTPEVNTSRRSDHDARYKVSWGPVLALNSTLAAQDTAVMGKLLWPQKSGPQAISTTSTTPPQSLPPHLGVDRYSPLSGSSLLSRSLDSRPRLGAIFFDRLQQPVESGVSVGSLAEGEDYVTTLALDFMWRGGDLFSSSEVWGVPGDRGFRLGADWSGLWRILPRAQRYANLDSTCFNPTRVGLGLAQFLASLNENKNASLLLAWQQDNVINPCRELEALNAAVSEALLDSMSTRFCPNGSALFGVGDATKKTGYTPIESRISNIRRLRVTQGIYLPADLPIHGIFGSKDVIHSWAVPGLGVKVDCIPGYSSHRRLFFRWRGLFWGQCMEVCGRYHHWMPLLVRIVHKDVFVIWCLTYLRLLNGTTQTSQSVFSLTESKLAWNVAASVSSERYGFGVAEANSNALLNF